MHYNANMSLPLFTQRYPQNSQHFNELVSAQVSSALAEDIGTGDLTASLISETALAIATIISRENAVICGIDWVNA
jgi:nicotinate-nucleotide pyrophosphorylase (carboxylating)